MRLQHLSSRSTWVLSKMPGANIRFTKKKPGIITPDSGITFMCAVTWTQSRGRAPRDTLVHSATARATPPRLRRA